MEEETGEGEYCGTAGMGITDYFIVAKQQLRK